MSFYGERFSLHDLDDVEAACAGAARRFDQKVGPLSYHELEALVAFLVSAVWQMAERHDPAKSPSFAGFARERLPARCIDWYRVEKRRTKWKFRDREYERPAQAAVSLDALTDSGAEVGVVDGELQGDSEAGDLADLCGGLLSDRGGDLARDTVLIRALAGRLLQVRVVGDNAAKREWIEAQKARLGEQRVEEVAA